MLRRCPTGGGVVRCEEEDGVQVLCDQSQDPGGPRDAGEEPDLGEKEVRIAVCSSIVRCVTKGEGARGSRTPSGLLHLLDGLYSLCSEEQQGFWPHPVRETCGGESEDHQEEVSGAAGLLQVEESCPQVRDF